MRVIPVTAVHQRGFGETLRRDSWWTTPLFVFIVLGSFVGYATSMYVLLDSLWPLWDGKRQALHDKAAKTNVVRVR